MARFWKLLLLMVTITIVDQMSKGAIQSSMQLGDLIPVIPGFFNISYVQNTGAAFGFMAGAGETVRQILFLLLPVLVCVWVFVLLVKSLKGPLYLSIAYALILSGATGNLIDRFSLGYVVDFLDFYIGTDHYPSFNVADSAITIAAFLLGYDYFCELKKGKKQIDD